MLVLTEMEEKVNEIVKDLSVTPFSETDLLCLGQCGETRSVCQMADTHLKEETKIVQASTVFAMFFSDWRPQPLKDRQYHACQRFEAFKCDFILLNTYV